MWVEDKHWKKTWREDFDKYADRSKKWEQTAANLLANIVVALNEFSDAVRANLNPDFFLLQGKRFRAQWPETKRLLKKTILTYPHERFYFPTHILELLALQNLQDELPNEAWRFQEVSQPGDKIERAGVLSDYAKNSNVYICNDKFGDYFIREHCGFPDEITHDDCVDVSSVASHALGLNQRFDITIASIGRRQHNE